MSVRVSTGKGVLFGGDLPRYGMKNCSNATSDSERGTDSMREMGLGFDFGRLFKFCITGAVIFLSQKGIRAVPNGYKQHNKMCFIILVVIKENISLTTSAGLTVSHGYFSFFRRR